MKISREDLRQRLLPILLSQAIGLACGIIGVRLTSHLVDPADYGIYGIFVSLASIGAGVIYIGLVKYVSRHWQGSTDRPGLLRVVFAATVRKAPWLLAAATLATLLAASGQQLVFGVVLFASAYLLTLTQMAQSALQAAREHWRDLGVSAGVSVSRSFLPPLLYAATGAGVRALLVGFLGQALLGALLGAGSLRRWWRRNPTAAPSSPSLTPHYDGPRFVALAIAGWVLVGLNRWLVAWFFGTETAGFFMLASNIGVILPAMLGLVLLLYCQPPWFESVHATLPQREALLRDVDRAAGLYTMLALGLAGALHLAMPGLIGPLVSAKYTPAATFVLMTGFSTTSITIGTFYHAMLLAAKREPACSTADLTGAACLMTGSVLSAVAGLAWFKGWLILAPVVPWLVNRPLARRALLKAA